jgi:hypothetical protein
MPAGPFAENENRNPLLTQPEDFQPPAAQHHP